MNEEMSISHITDEARIAHLVRSTLQVATQPTPGQLRLTPAQLRALIPPTPIHRSFTAHLLSLTWARQPQWVALLACVFLVIGSLSAYFSRQPAGWLPENRPALSTLAITGSASAVPASLTYTPASHTPTSTVAQHPGNGPIPLQTAVPAIRIISPLSTATPTPNPTPVTALWDSLLSN